MRHFKAQNLVCSTGLNIGRSCTNKI